MNDLRYTINSQNIDINNLLEMIGLKDKNELNEASLKKFLSTINPKIT